MLNPYAKRSTRKKVVAMNQGEISENLRFPGQSSYAVARNGEINASSKRDLMGQISHLLKASRDGAIVDEQPTKEQRLAIAQEVKEYWAEAKDDPEKWKAVGESITDDIQETLDRQGFARHCLKQAELGQGEWARVRFRRKNMEAYYANGVGEIAPLNIREDYFTPPEFYISTKLMAEERDIRQSSGDILDEKYNEGLEMMMVTEDRLLKKFADVAKTNPATVFNTFTPLHFTKIKGNIGGWRIPVSHAILAYDLWDDMVAQPGFADWYDPVTKHEVVLTGSLGRIMEVELWTDCTRLPEHQVLNAGDIYFWGAPDMLGIMHQCSDGIVSNPIEPTSTPERGWFLYQIITMMIMNAKAISVGHRV